MGGDIDRYTDHGKQRSSIVIYRLDTEIMITGSDIMPGIGNSRCLCVSSSGGNSCVSGGDVGNVERGRNQKDGISPGGLYWLVLNEPPPRVAIC